MSAVIVYEKLSIVGIITAPVLQLKLGYTYIYKMTKIRSLLKNVTIQTWQNGPLGNDIVLICLWQSFENVHEGKVMGITHNKGAVFTCSSDKTIKVWQPTKPLAHINTIRVHNMDIAEVKSKLKYICITWIRQMLSINQCVCVYSVPIYNT